MEMIPPCFRRPPVIPLKEDWCTVCKGATNPKYHGKCKKKTRKPNTKAMQNLNINMTDHISSHEMNEKFEPTERPRDGVKDHARRAAAAAARRGQITEGVGSNSNRQSVAGEFHTRLCST
jgi:hypothetical protein